MLFENSHRARGDAIVLLAVDNGIRFVDSTENLFGNVSLVGAANRGITFERSSANTLTDCELVDVGLAVALHESTEVRFCSPLLDLGAVEVVDSVLEVSYWVDVSVSDAKGAAIANAEVQIVREKDGRVLYATTNDEHGKTPPLELLAFSLTKTYDEQPCAYRIVASYGELHASTVLQLVEDTSLDMVLRPLRVQLPQPAEEVPEKAPPLSILVAIGLLAVFIVWCARGRR
jgi:hypothetical protein